MPAVPALGSPNLGSPSKPPPVPPPPPGADDIETTPGRIPTPLRTAVPAVAPPKAKPGMPMDIDWDDEDEKTTVFDKMGEDAARSLLQPSAPPAAGSKPPAPKPAAGAPPPPMPSVAPPPPPSKSMAPPPAPRASAPPPPAPAPVGRSSGPPPPAPAVSKPPPAASRPAPPPQPKLSAPPPAPVAATALPTITGSAPIADPFRSSQSDKVKWAAIAAAAVVVVIGVIFLLVPGSGALVVSVAGPGNKAVEKVKVFIDDKQVCDASPCIAKDLEAGTHIVKVVAEGYGSTAGKAYSVEAGTETPVNITLAAPSPGTGIHVKHDGSGLKLWVDGKEIGPLPQELKEMSPGSHEIKIGGSDRYEEYKETINVEADKIALVEPKLKVLKGEATLEPGDNADGAKILLVSGKERRPLNKDLPVRLEVGTDKRYKIVATKKGYEPYENFIEFDDGKAEKTFIISLKEASEGAEEEGDDEPEAAAAPAPRRPAPAPPRGAPAPRARAAAPAGKGTLNINSIPVSKVILDGVPKGTTPVIGVKVSPGTHTVVFMHPQHGRKVRAVTVQSGKTATAAVRFP